MPTEFKLVSYNIQDGIYEDLIIQNIHTLVDDGADIFCLQETRTIKLKPDFIVDRLKAELGNEWQGECFLGIDNPRLEVGLTILWKSTNIHLLGLEKIFLPKSNYVGLYDSLIRYFFIPAQRGAIVATFDINGIKLRIANLHLDFKQGVARRMSQVKYLAAKLGQKSVTHEIICGDFNTSVKNDSARKQKNWVEQILGNEYVEAFPMLKWTFDGASIDPAKFFSSAHKLLLRLGLRFYRRLDYVFVKNLKTTKSKLEKLQGSDHYPLVITFEV